MKLILTADVPGLGAPGDTVEVRDGYGRNYLLPRGFAIKWTRGAAKQRRLALGDPLGMRLKNGEDLCGMGDALAVQHPAPDLVDLTLGMG